MLSCVLVVFIMYFMCDTIQVPCPEDYLQWLQSMYSLFGTKWSKLHCGPMNCVEPTEQGGRVQGGREDTFKVNLHYHNYVHTPILTLMHGFNFV